MYLFRSCFTNFYSCDLWSLTTNKLQDLCTDVHSVSNLPQSKHRYLIPSTRIFFLVFEDIFRFSNSALDCISYESDLIKQMTSDGIYYAHIVTRRLDIICCFALMGIVLLRTVYHLYYFVHFALLCHVSSLFHSYCSLLHSPACFQMPHY